MNQVLSLDGLAASLSDPSLAFFLLMAGIYGLVYELAQPGLSIAGLLGLVCIALAFLGFRGLPVNGAGMALVVVGMVLFASELWLLSHGLLSLGGLVALVVGSRVFYGSG